MRVAFRPLLGSVMTVLLLVGSAPVSADGHVTVNGSGSALTGQVERVTSNPGNSSGGGGPVSSGGSSAPTGPRPVVTRTKRGITYDYTHVGGGQMRYVYDDYRDYCHGNIDVTTCYGPAPAPGEPRRRAPVPPPLSPTEVVERTIVNVRLPRPRPSIDPGYAVTGMKAYLETGNSTTHTFEPINTVLGPLSITATSTYTVKWGDGETSGPHNNSGGAYPNGRITHVYRHARTVDIVVTQNWTAQWSLAGQSGTIGGLSSSGTLPNFVVREVQAVRRR